MRVIPERDPYFVIEEELVREGIGMFDRISTRGASEIVVESPDHGMTLQSADEAQIERVLWMYRDRVKDLKRDLKIRNVVVTRRYGKPGSAIRHPYSRILAAPIVFDDLRTELTQAREYYAYKRRCVFCDTIREEIGRGDRLIQLTSHFAAFVPYAARVPFELRVLPRRHASAFEAIAPDEVADLARLLKSLSGLLVKAIGDPSYRDHPPHRAEPGGEDRAGGVGHDRAGLPLAPRDPGLPGARHVGGGDRRDRHASRGGGPHPPGGRVPGAPAGLSPGGSSRRVPRASTAVRIGGRCLLRDTSRPVPDLSTPDRLIRCDSRLFRP